MNQDGGLPLTLSPCHPVTLSPCHFRSLPMAPLRVLMVNTPQSVKFRGGDTTQMVKTAEALRRMGHEVGESVDAEPDGSNYDIAHIFNSRTIAATPGQVLSLRRAGIPVVMSPI